MFDEQENIFNVPHSLPNSAHPISLATRTPTGLVKANSTRFMPDYGGSLEVPGTKSKRYRLRRGVPFHMQPQYAHVVSTGVGRAQRKPGDIANLVVAPYLDSDPELGPSISVVRAIGTTLYFNVLQPIQNETAERIESHTYSHVPYPYQVTGLKYCDTMDKYLIVKFEQGVKLMRLNETYKVNAYRSPDSSDTEEEEPSCDRISISKENVVNFVGSYPERRGQRLGDACLTTTQKTLAITSSDSRNISIRLYDVNSSKKFYKSIVRAREDNALVISQQAQQRPANLRRSLRSFVPIRKPFETTQQLESDPTHLIHMLLTTSNRVSLVDIRADALQHNFVDRFRLMSILPSEMFNRIVFSRQTDQQFYLLSNERVRVFDRRFLSQPIVSLEHMLDPSTHTAMSMRLINIEQSEVETLCVSSYGRLCFLSFDRSNASQSQLAPAGELVTPTSMHPPLHEPSPVENSGNVSKELYGLDVGPGSVFESKKMLFSVFQLTQKGDISVRGYEQSSEDFQVDRTPTQARVVLEQHKQRKPQTDKHFPSTLDDDDLSNRIRDPDPDIPEDECLNILDASSIVCAEDRLTSKRALEKFDLMKKKLYKR